MDLFSMVRLPLTQDKTVADRWSWSLVRLWRNLEQILKKLPAPYYEEPELAGQWEKDWLKSKKFVVPYQPPYLNK